MLYTLDPDLFRQQELSSGLQAALDQIPDGSEIHFPRGTYRFDWKHCQDFTCSLSNSDFSPVLHAGLLLKNRQDLILDGQGSTLLCHGQMTPIALMGCRNLCLRNFTLDWDIPLTAEGTVIASSEDHTDVAIDPRKFPFHLKDGHLYFDGGDWSCPLHSWGHTEFDPATDQLAFDRGDRFPPTTQALLPGGQVRFLGDFSGREPTPGNILVLRHGDRVHPGLLIHHCRHIAVRDLNLNGSGGLGILAQFSHTLSFSRVYIGPNRSAGRRFAGGHDDGIHLSGNSGSVSIRDCTFLGLMDDPINLHGIAARVRMQPKGDIILGSFLHPQSKGHRLWAEPGQVLALLNGETMEELARVTVADFQLLDRENFKLTLNSPVSLEAKNLALENLTCTASLFCRGNHFGGCRARGLLVSTPRKVVIAENTFQSPGAAIRIAGDVCTWYESGRSTDVTIIRNDFLDTCLSNSYEGGQGILSLSPELPSPDSRHPCHRNIRIRENHFLLSDPRILYALATENLDFSHNTIQKSSRFPKGAESHPQFRLEHCRQIRIQDNLLSGF